MNRQIKFRAWDKVNNQMCEVIGFNFLKNTAEVVEKTGDTHGHILHFLPRKNNEVGFGYLMQFTGLKDKNGKEIYENDYLGDWCVFWGSGKYILQNISTGDIMDCNEENTQQKEITGNRFEHPREHKAMETDL